MLPKSNFPTTMAFLLALLLPYQLPKACTTFVLQNQNQLLFGRNLDWISENGFVSINQRNLRKKSIVFPPDKPIEWTSKFGSLTFNQFGKEFPFGGINEAGLVVEIMVSHAEYELPDERKAINELQWIQYQLDNHQSVEEVILSGKFLRLSSIHQNLHFLVCDSTGNTAVIEFKNHRMVIFQGNELPIPVLENDGYEASLKNYAQNKACRFNTAAKMLDNFNPKAHESAVEYAFNILNKVAISAEWSIVYDIRNLTVYFKTASNPTIRFIKLGALEVNCHTKPLYLNLKSKNSGNVNIHLIPIRKKVHKHFLKQAVHYTAIPITQSQLKQFLHLPFQCPCVSNIP